MPFSYLKWTLPLLLLLVAPCQNALGQSRLDSLMTLSEVVVLQTTHKDVIPAQKLSGTALNALKSVSVADAIRFFSGVQVKDYGGIGGLKTINIRSMGSHHVGVFYDGLQLGNAQNGQVDLGKYSMDNIEAISLYNGQKSEILQPAKDFGASGSVYIQSRAPIFSEKKTRNLKGTLRSGSFGLLSSSILYEQQLSKRINGSLTAELLRASGKYKFRYRRKSPSTHEVLYDTTAIRENGDIQAQRVEAGLYGTLPEGNWRAKAYFYNSARGIPGAVVNNRWSNFQRQWDRSLFVQASLKKQLSPKYEIQARGKWAYDYLRYLNPDTTLMLIDNSFHQKEVYLSLANKYKILPFWETALSFDLQRNTLHSNVEGFVYPRRLSSFLALATSLHIDRFKGQASLLSTIIRDRIEVPENSLDGTLKKRAHPAPSRHELSPGIFLSYKLLEDLTLRGFYKSAFRMPTFNDLYYTEIGNVNLKPEFTKQFNLGGAYHKAFPKIGANISVQADLYMNKVTDKIVAVPKGDNQYRWMMMNLGYVEIRGADLSLSTSYRTGAVLLDLRLAYTYQKAQDFTKKEPKELQDLTYGGQIAYIPWHSGTAIGSLAYKEWILNYSFIYVGERYHDSANIKKNYEQPWYTSDLHISRSFDFSGKELRITGEINNLLSQDYEVVLNYPMPKRNYKLTLSLQI